MLDDVGAQGDEMCAGAGMLGDGGGLGEDEGLFRDGGEAAIGYGAFELRFLNYLLLLLIPGLLVHTFSVPMSLFLLPARFAEGNADPVLTNVCRCVRVLLARTHVDETDAIGLRNGSVWSFQWLVRSLRRIGSAVSDLPSES